MVRIFARVEARIPAVHFPDFLSFCFLKDISSKVNLERKSCPRKSENGLQRQFQVKSENVIFWLWKDFLFSRSGWPWVNWTFYPQMKVEKLEKSSKNWRIIPNFCQPILRSFADYTICRLKWETVPRGNFRFFLPEFRSARWSHRTTFLKSARVTVSQFRRFKNSNLQKYKWFF